MAAGSVSPVVVAQQTNTSNSAVTTWTALAVNGHAFGVLKPQTSAADGDNTNGLTAIKTACKAKTQSTGYATVSSNYIAPTQFYATWRDTVSGGTGSSSSSSSSAGSSDDWSTAAYTFGGTGPGGGNVFYYRPSGFACGPTLAATCKYLEVAKTTGTAAWIDRFAAWSGNTTTSVTTGTAVGTGYQNTIAIVTDNSTANRAGTYTRAYRGPNNLDDWFLPSLDELNQLCKWQRGQAWVSDATLCNNTGSNNSGPGTPAFSDGYWSSSQSAAGTASVISFDPTVSFSLTLDKGGFNGVRPIRAFG